MKSLEKTKTKGAKNEIYIHKKAEQNKQRRKRRTKSIKEKADR